MLAELDQLTVTQLASRIVWSRKIREMKAKGRTMTSRVARQWKTQGIAEAIEVIRRAADAAGRAAVKDDELVEYVRLMLIRELLHILLPRRPRRTGPGLLADEGAVRKQAHRPAEMTPEEERSWVHRVFGMKVGLFIEAGGFRDYAEVYRHLSPGRFDELSEIHDVAAVRFAAEARIGPRVGSLDRRELTALATRYRRAIKKYGVKLPKPKSGG